MGIDWNCVSLIHTREDESITITFCLRDDAPISLNDFQPWTTRGAMMSFDFPPMYDSDKAEFYYNKYSYKTAYEIASFLKSFTYQFPAYPDKSRLYRLVGFLEGSKDYDYKRWLQQQRNILRREIEDLEKQKAEIEQKLEKANKLGATF